MVSAKNDNGQDSSMVKGVLKPGKVLHEIDLNKKNMKKTLGEKFDSTMAALPSMLSNELEDALKQGKSENAESIKFCVQKEQEMFKSKMTNNYKTANKCFNSATKTAKESIKKIKNANETTEGSQQNVKDVVQNQKTQMETCDQEYWKKLTALQEKHANVVDRCIKNPPSVKNEKN